MSFLQNVLTLDKRNTTRASFSGLAVLHFACPVSSVSSNMLGHCRFHSSLNASKQYSGAHAHLQDGRDDVSVGRDANDGGATRSALRRRRAASHTPTNHNSSPSSTRPSVRPSPSISVHLRPSPSIRGREISFRVVLNRWRS